MSGCAHQEADMERSLPHSPPVLHVPAVLSEPLRVGLLGVASYQLSQQRAVLKLEVEGLISQGLGMGELH